MIGVQGGWRVTAGGGSLQSRVKEVGVGIPRTSPPPPLYTMQCIINCNNKLINSSYRAWQMPNTAPALFFGFFVVIGPKTTWVGCARSFG